MSGLLPPLGVGVFQLQVEFQVQDLDLGAPVSILGLTSVQSWRTDRPGSSQQRSSSVSVPPTRVYETCRRYYNILNEAVQAGSRLPVPKEANIRAPALAPVAAETPAPAEATCQWHRALHEPLADHVTGVELSTSWHDHELPAVLDEDEDSNENDVKSAVDVSTVKSRTTESCMAENLGENVDARVDSPLDVRVLSATSGPVGFQRPSRAPEKPQRSAEFKANFFSLRRKISPTTELALQCRRSDLLSPT